MRRRMKGIVAVCRGSAWDEAISQPGKWESFQYCCQQKLTGFARRFRLLALLGCALAFTCWECAGSRFARELRFTQPDGTVLRLWSEGDPFHAVTETLDGYTVVFVPESRAYFYARAAADRTALESTGVMVGQADPVVAGLSKHERIDAHALALKASSMRTAWEKSVQLRERWADLKAGSPDAKGPSPAPPGFQTVGTKCGLTILIDFEAERGTISRDEVIEFLNGDNYTGFGNNGSVKQYYADNSNGRLTFTNVVTPYITIPTSLHPRNYYNDPTKDCGIQGQLLVRDALNVMKTLPNFTNDFLPLLQSVTFDTQNYAVSANFYVAGNDSGVWGQGIWGHSWAMSSYLGVQTLWPGGKMVNRYQLSPMASALALYIFCHENGHMMCGFPDLYDYGFDSIGGAGTLCMMDYPTSETNPSQFCAYLKTAAGWATVTDLPWGTNLVASLSSAGTNFNRFYRIRKSGTEYFLLENRQPTGHDAETGIGGIAIWHIDEAGNKDDQSLATNSTHLNYEVTLEQADNRWDLNYARNLGHSEDCYYLGNPAPGYANAFSDLTFPGAQWWDGRRSGLRVSDFSTNGETITFQAQNAYPPPILFDPTDVTVYEGQRATFSFRANTTALNIQWYKDGLPLELSSRITNVTSLGLTIAPAELADVGNYTAILTHAGGSESTRNARLTVLPGPALLSTNFGIAGGTVFLPDGVEMTASAGSIAGASDTCRFVYQTVSGDFDVRVRLKGIGMKATDTRAGLMIRKSLTATSPHFTVLTGLLPTAAPWSVLARSTVMGVSQELLNYLGPLADPSSGLPNMEQWLRLQRQGNRLTAYRSQNGSDWHYLRSLELDLGAAPSVGMMLAAGPSATSAASASFRDFQLSSNPLPTLSLFTGDCAATEGILDSAGVAVYCSRNGPLQLDVTYGGVAVNGYDYLPLPRQVLIPAGTNVALLNIRAIDNGTPNEPKTVEIALPAQPRFDIARPSKAKALILDHERRGGGLKRQFYPELGGSDVASVKRAASDPTAQVEPGIISSFETPTNLFEYGEVVSGYLVPPETGNYVFCLASHDSSELWLSTGEYESGARLIASVVGFTAFRDYLASGRSAPISLRQGEAYYVRAWHKQRSGRDCFSVAWQTPSGPAVTNGSPPIPGEYLAFRPPSSYDVVFDPLSARVSPLRSTNTFTFWISGSPSETVDIRPSGWIGGMAVVFGGTHFRVTYFLEPNPDPTARCSTIMVGDHIFPVIQEAAPSIRMDFSATHSLQLVCTSETTTQFVLEASSDLLNWQPIYNGTFPATVDLAAADPTSATKPVRFYRTVVNR